MRPGEGSCLDVTLARLLLLRGQVVSAATQQQRRAAELAQPETSPMAGG